MEAQRASRLRLTKVQRTRLQIRVLPFQGVVPEIRQAAVLLRQALKPKKPKLNELLSFSHPSESKMRMVRDTTVLFLNIG
jgi:hypothetical protein